MNIKKTYLFTILFFLLCCSRVVLSVIMFDGRLLKSVLGYHAKRICKRSNEHRCWYKRKSPITSTRLSKSWDACVVDKLKDYYDFIIEKDKKFPGLINLIGIDSPGLTSSLAIAKYVKELLA